MDYKSYITLYKMFKQGFRHKHYDMWFTSKSKKIIQNIMKKEQLNRQQAGLFLYDILNNKEDEVSKYYV